MIKTKIAKMALAGAVIASASLTTKAATIDFGTSWPAFTAVGAGDYASAPYDRLMGMENGTHSTETQIAAYLDIVTGETFVAGDIHKTDHPPELGGSDGYFTVPGGWDYLVVQYDGPNGGSIVLELDGNDAKVPFDSSLIWGSGDQYGVSHFSVAGAAELPIESITTPDSGTTAALLGVGLIGMAIARRKLS